MGISVWQILIVLLIVLILFGAGKLPRVMGDFARGINSFKKGLKEDEEVADAPGDRTIESKPAPMHGGVEKDHTVRG